MRESHLTGTSTRTKRFPARRIAAAVPLLAAAATWAQTAGMELQGNAPPQPPSRAASSALPVLPPAPKGGAEAGGPTIELRALRIEGNASVPTELLQSAVGPVIGRKMTLQDLQGLADRITAAYRSRGFALARAYLPAQKVTDGEVVVQVVEGAIGKVSARGDDAKVPGAQPFLDAGIPLGAPVRSDTLERTMLLLDDQPGFSVRPVLRPGAQFGETELQVDVERRNQVSGEVGLDNTGNESTGAYRLRGLVNINSPFRFGDRVSLTALVTDEKLWLGSAEYETPLDATGTRGSISLSRSSYQLDGAFAALGAKGLADSVSGRLTRALIRSQQTNLLASLNLSHKILEQQYDALGITRKRKSDLLSPGLQFDVRDGIAGGGVTYGQVSATLGRLRLDDASRALDGATARTRGSFQRFNLDLARIQRLSDTFSAYVRLSAQWSGGNLDASEKFGLGGFLGVRAYPMGEGSGDRGWMAQTELRATVAAGMTAFVWGDGGQVKLNAKPWDAGSDGRRGLAGAGIGGRWTAGRWVAESTLGWRVRGGRPEAEDRDRNPRWFLSAGYRFD
jgi:hemolysin activation/secretion protein